MNWENICVCSSCEYSLWLERSRDLRKPEGVRMGQGPGYQGYHSHLLPCTAFSSCHSGSMALTELPESNSALQHHSSTESLACVCLYPLLQTGNCPRGTSLIRAVLWLLLATRMTMFILC